MAEAMVAVDGTQIVTTSCFLGCGCLRVTKKKRDAQGLVIKEAKLVFGWRLIALLDLMTLIPVAIKIVQIQEYEAPFLVALVQQAQANLAPYSRIRWLLIDCAYVDGATLYALHQMGIAFVVIAKSNMAAHTTALALSTDAPLLQRGETVRHGHGGQAWTEGWMTSIQAVTGIRTWRSYRPPKVPGQRLRWKDRPALNVVVVSLWRNHQPGKDGARVYLTNARAININAPRQMRFDWQMTRCYPATGSG